MVQSVLLEQSKEEEIFYLLEHQLWTIGLLIGRITSSRHYISFIVKTPLPDDPEENTKAKKSKGKNKKAEKWQKVTAQEIADTVDESWITEHARQVTRCLPGGLCVMGLFLIAPDDISAAMQPKIRTLMYNSCELSTSVFPGTRDSHKDEEQLQRTIPSTRVFLQVSSDTKQHKCRVINVSDQKSNFRPAELNFLTHSIWFHKVEGKMKVNTSFKLPQRVGDKRTLIKELKDCLKPTLQSVLSGIVAFHGCFVPSDVPLVKSGKSAAKAETLPTILYRKTHRLDSGSDITTTQSSGCIHLKGTIYTHAFVHGKATHGEAETALKQDIFRTLLARVELLCEDLYLQKEAEQELLPEEQQQKPLVIQLPNCSSHWKLPIRRLATVPEVPFPLSDYSLEGEETEESADRICRCLDVGLDASDIDIIAVEDFGEVKDISSLTKDVKKSVKQPVKGSYYWRSIAGAAATALLAYLIWFSQESTMS
ncbi:protein odr-4 homolog isoform X2 [Dysidea avara]|uniref:protein odr-4 homolog isoform X2 n=1 Tax=Dysidea avara TaxID=196820 RepID=UPI0033297953